MSTCSLNLYFYFKLLKFSIFLLSLQVEMENMATKKKYFFKCNRWLADDEDDGAIIREIPAEGDGIKKPQPCK